MNRVIFYMVIFTTLFGQAASLRSQTNSSRADLTRILDQLRVENEQEIVKKYAEEVRLAKARGETKRLRFEIDQAIAKQKDENSRQEMEMLVLVAFIGWFICTVFAAHLGEQRNAGMAGFFLGFLFGPVGMIAAGFLDGRPNCSRCGGRQNVKPKGARYEVCEHCGERTSIPIPLSAADKAKEDARQQRLVCTGAAASIVAPILFAFTPSQLGAYEFPAYMLLLNFAGIWFVVFRLAQVAWDRWAGQFVTRFVGTE